ncbi:hypothetical protein [Chitinophaga sp. RAB17]|uniref:hypothetical protein n=1 Tax=Chitinophaga sp. RAB17 TaxID=3233049 RepID=UPI003F93A8FC
MKTLEKFSTFNQGLEDHELAQVSGGDYRYTVRNYYGTITYFRITALEGRTLEGSQGVDSGGNDVNFMSTDHN